MRNLILSALSAGLLFAMGSATPASAATRVNVNLSLGEPPRVYFARPPRTILIPDTQVYYVEDMDDYGYDMFQCDGFWYIDDAGYWFRAPSYRGPFVSVSYASVPSRVINVPSAYAHQPWRPGVWRSDSRRYGSYGGYYNRGYQGGYQSRGYQRGDDRNWRDSDQRWQDRQQWQRRSNDDQGHGRGHGHNHGRGHDRHDRGDNDDQ